MTPFEVMFGCTIDIELRKKTPEEVHDYAECEESDCNDTLKELGEQRRERLELVRANIDVAQKKQKENYDRQRDLPKYRKFGALVLLKYHTRKKRKGGKANSLLDGMVHLNSQSIAPWYVCYLIKLGESEELQEPISR